MLLSRKATDKELSDVAKLEVWNLHSVLEEGKLSPLQRIVFLNELIGAARSIIEPLEEAGLAHPKVATNARKRCRSCKHLKSRHPKTGMCNTRLRSTEPKKYCTCQEYK